MVSTTVKKLEKELISALEDSAKNEAQIKVLMRKYRTVVFGPNYESPSSVGDICSFCAKAEKDIEQFVAGANAFICNECIELCYGIINEK